MKKIILDTDYAEISHDSELILGKIEWLPPAPTEYPKFAEFGTQEGKIARGSAEQKRETGIL